MTPGLPHRTQTGSCSGSLVIFKVRLMNQGCLGVRWLNLCTFYQKPQHGRNCPESAKRHRQLGENRRIKLWNQEFCKHIDREQSLPASVSYASMTPCTVNPRAACCASVLNRWLGVLSWRDPPLGIGFLSNPNIIRGGPFATLVPCIEHSARFNQE